MNKFLMFFSFFIGVFIFCSYAQDSANNTSNDSIVSSDDSTITNTSATDINDAIAEDPIENESEVFAEEETEPQKNFHQIVKERFIEGDATFMMFPLLCLIFGLAISIERIIYLNMSSVNTKKLLDDVEKSLNDGGVDASKEVCKNTRGPVASIFTQGLMRISEGIDMVEKSIISYGSVEMGKLERGMIWISLFISLAPMLGFMGTVIGMIDAFNAIAEAGDVSPALVAGGIKVALLTTVAGLIVAVILQLFYNYLVSKIDSIVNNMEDASISLVDILVKHKISK